MAVKQKRIPKGAIIPITSGLENSVLRKVSKSVESLTPAVEQLIADMHATMEKEQGIGIAAPQIGVNFRVALAKLNPATKQEKIITMINPEIISRSMQMEIGEEGCLSLRGKWGKTERSFRLTVRFFDENWKEHKLNLESLNARIIQHEVDHLDGVLFLDRVREEDN